MTREYFIEFMNKFKVLHQRNSEWYDDIDRAFGTGSTEEIISHSYETFIIDFIESQFEDKACESISFLIYECDWDFEEYCEKTLVDGEHPIIKNFGDFYDHLRPAHEI